MDKLKLRICLIGGARRVTLVEQFIEIAASAIEITFLSVERDDGFYPISSIAEVVPGPSFGTPEFERYLSSIVADGATLPVACMDAAVPALAALRGFNMKGVTVIAPDKEGALVSLNKVKTALFCQKNGINCPQIFDRPDAVSGRVIAKPVDGFGGKGIIVFENASLVPNSFFETHIVQQFIDGKETTHDLYVDEEGEVIACSRDRLAVIDGEVDHCIVRRATDDEMLIFKKLAASGLFWGPLTVQTIKNNEGCFLIEINSRLGGGVTASIAAGFPVFEKYIEEATGVRLSRRQFRPLEMKRARRDFYRFLA